MLPTLIQRGASAPKTALEGWEVYWKGIQSTGPGGDVLWDPAHAEEIEFCLQKSLQHAERTLPIIDIGCGNGRYTRVLSRAFARAVGIDLSKSAVERARRESAENNATFQVQDVAGSGWAQPLHGELGDVNVFIRGVLHILEHRQKQVLVDNVQILLGKRGTLFLLETAFEGGPLITSSSWAPNLGSCPRSSTKPSVQVCRSLSVSRRPSSLATFRVKPSECWKAEPLRSSRSA